MWSENREEEADAGRGETDEEPLSDKTSLIWCV